ncbi:MAG TPA: DNA-formamidopyrimidine glycosylase family protein [Marmoricola sp.]|nr:DNA-formamidopyrimidine glycosylase family protein [Marmoricola sp.]
MPEGDTVWRTARTLHHALSGAEISADFRFPSLATHGFTATMIETVSRGKHLLTRFDNDLTLHTHLKMEGSWHLYKPGQRWRRPTHEARVVLRGTQWHAVGFALGIVDLIRTSAESDAVGHLGPDLLGADWNPDEAVSRLATDPARSIGEALLDQRNLAGVGNMYRAELCFLLGAHPLTPVSEVDLARVVRRAKALLEANKQRVEQTTTGDTRPDRRLWVYGRERKPCRRCGTPIQRESIGEPARSGYWCPSCQPAPHQRH